MANKTTNYGLTKPIAEDFYDVNVMNENMDIIDSELKKKYDSKNKPTPADIGAAPAGYGLGVSTETLTSVTDCNNAIKNGWYCIDGITKNSPLNGASGAMRVDVQNSSNIIQTVYSSTFNGIMVAQLQRTKFNNTWREWEHVNPALTIGKEYRTTERIKGKAVYKKNVDGVIHYRLEDETEWKPYADVVGAVKKSGDTMTGGLTFKKVDNGYALIEKDHSDSTDYGTRIYDYDVNGDKVVLKLRAKDHSVSIDIKEGTKVTSHTILHLGNYEEYVFKKSGDAFYSTVKAGATVQAPGTSLLRNSKLVNTETNPTDEGEICWTYK